MQTNAERGLKLRKEFNRGGTMVGVARANQLKSRERLSPSTVRRMHSYFSRHEVDKRGKGETVEELANKQLEKSIRLTTSAAIIDGMESAAITAIESTQTSEELDTLMASLLVGAESELNGLLAGAQ